MEDFLRNDYTKETDIALAVLIPVGVVFIPWAIWLGFIIFWW